MIRYYTTEELQHPEKFFKDDDSELFMTKDELKKAKRTRITTPKERAWTIDSKLNALRDI